MPQQYLSRYAEPEAALAPRLTRHYQHVLAVPACDENVDALLALPSDCPDAGVLCVVVVNGAEHHDAALHERNRALLVALSSRTRSHVLSPNAQLGAHAGRDWLVIDRASETHRFGKRHGVGLARRVAADVACALWHEGRVASGLIHMSDADARLPADYFSFGADARVAAWTYPFRHLPSAEATLDRAHAIYELYLRYYVLGLRYAGSRCAFHTIGSTIAVDALAYAKVRGMPKRQAAEDFYLLNKLAKVGAVRCPDTGPVRLVARHSARVPFGTGRATASIVADGLRWAVYHPDVFVALRALLHALDQLCSAAGGGGGGAEGIDEALEAATTSLPTRLGDALQQAWAGQDAEALARSLAGAPAGQRATRLGEWLDAFRTRKLVHGLRDAGLGTLPWWEALTRAPFGGLSLAEEAPQAALWEACEQLAAAERLATRQQTPAT